MVADMLDHLKENIKKWDDQEEIDAYLYQMLNKEVYNKTGLIYGIGHAVYTISDPRAILLKELARDLAKEKGRTEEMDFLELVEARCFKSSANIFFAAGEAITALPVGMR